MRNYSYTQCYMALYCAIVIFCLTLSPLCAKMRNVLCWCGSMVEHLTRNEKVVGSIPTISSTSEQALYRLLRLFSKSQSALIPLLLLFKPQTLRWFAAWWDGALDWCIFFVNIVHVGAGFVSLAPIYFISQVYVPQSENLAGSRISAAGFFFGVPPQVTRSNWDRSIFTSAITRPLHCVQAGFCTYKGETAGKKRRVLRNAAGNGKYGSGELT